MSEYEIKRWIREAKESVQVDVRRFEERRLADNRQLAEAFNKMTQAINSLAGEVSALRSDLSPQKLDKPRLPMRGSLDDGNG